MSATLRSDQIVTCATRNALAERFFPAIFCFGLGIVLLALLVGVGSPWHTFIHMWKAELAASLFVLCSFAYAGTRANFKKWTALSGDEAKFLLLPLGVFIFWSGVSAFWASSWKSVIHHTTLWILYLGFYVVCRQVLEIGSGYRKLLTAFGIVIACLSVPAIAQYAALQIFGGGNSLGVTHAKYGEFVNTLTPLLLVGVVRLAGTQFWLGAVGIITASLLIVCSLGRINLFLFGCGTLAALVIIVASGRFHRYRLKLAILFSALVLSPISLNLFGLLAAEPEIPVVARLADREGTDSSNKFRLLMLNIARGMITANPIIGIGADNFGFQANHYRAEFAADNPTDTSLAQAENNIPERAHNEYIQIMAELGVVGLGMFVWFLGGLFVLAFRACKRRSSVPVEAQAAVVGLGLFLVSSLVSSFSFRFVQSGLVFFFVLAVAAKILMKEKDLSQGRSVPSIPLVGTAFALGLIGCLALAIYSTVRVASVAVAARANTTTDIDEASHLYGFASDLDDENPDARFFHGMRLFREKRYAEAAEQLSESVRIGAARSTNFSYLASAHTLAGDNAAAERTMAKAAAMYPLSPFVLVRHAALLSANGKTSEAEVQLERARNIDLKAANTWWILVNGGAEKASRMAFRDENFVEVMDLQPIEAVYAVVAEREAKFPRERRNIPF